MAKNKFIILVIHKWPLDAKPFLQFGVIIITNHDDDTTKLSNIYNEKHNPCTPTHYYKYVIPKNRLPIQKIE